MVVAHLHHPYIIAGVLSEIIITHPMESNEPFFPIPPPRDSDFATKIYLAKSQWQGTYQVFK